MSNDRDQNATHSANPGYALGQIARAFVTQQTHGDAATRARAGRKVTDWENVLSGMLSGSLKIGSRTPVAAPAWATLRVIGGGFATGELLAEGDLQDHERDRLHGMPDLEQGLERAALNSHYLTEQGLAELQDMLSSGRYRIDVPEEGALLTVAWLVSTGRNDEARDLLDQLGPYLTRLRFYPVPTERATTVSAAVYLQEVRKTVADLRAVKPREQVEAQREAVLIWTPMYDWAVRLWAQTEEEGWPCQHYPTGWREEASQLLDQYRRLRRVHQLCNKPEEAKSNFNLLRAALAKAVKDKTSLTGREVGMVKRILADVRQKRGEPDSHGWQQRRRLQASTVQPSSAQVAKMLIERLLQLPQDGGLDSLDEVLLPVSSEESVRFNLPQGQEIPHSLVEKVRRSWEAPLEALVEMGIISSAEVLATVIPQISSQVGAAGIADPQLRRLYAGVYRAFRRRRSLLLLNLDSQVRLEELPWVKAVNAYRNPSDGQAKARQTLEEVVVLALTAFPETIIPNKLLTEIRALSKAAGMQLPLTEELAVDIFDGRFTEKFLRAAQIAGALLDGTLYQRYYRLPYARLRGLNDLAKRWEWDKATSPGFGGLCYELAGVEQPRGWSWGGAASNGKVVEQQQLLTTHNLAVLTEALDLVSLLGSRMKDLPRQCFLFVCRSQQQKATEWQAGMQNVKNCAYAWRQMVYFLTMLPEQDVEEFMLWASAHLCQQKGDHEVWAKKLETALDWLWLVAKGALGNEQSHTGNTARCFLGWTTERTHWLL